MTGKTGPVQQSTADTPDHCVIDIGLLRDSSVPFDRSDLYGGEPVEVGDKDLLLKASKAFQETNKAVHSQFKTFTNQYKTIWLKREREMLLRHLGKESGLSNEDYAKIMRTGVTLDALDKNKLANLAKIFGVALISLIVSYDTLCVCAHAILSNMQSKSNSRLTGFALNVVSDFTQSIMVVSHGICVILLKLMNLFTSPYNSIIRPYMEFMQEKFNMSPLVSLSILALGSATVIGALYVDLALAITAIPSLFSMETLAYVGNSTAVAFSLYCFNYWANCELKEASASNKACKSDADSNTPPQEKVEIDYRFQFFHKQTSDQDDCEGEVTFAKGPLPV